MITRDEYAKSANKRDSEAEDQIRRLAIMAGIQAEVHATKLTNDPDWDKLLQHLQYAIEKLGEAEKSWESKILDETVVNQDVLMMAKSCLSMVKGQKSALEWVIDLPKELKETGAIAATLKSDMLEN